MDTGIAAIIIALGGLIPSVIAIVLQRRGDKAKVKETEAQAELNIAEADRINSTTAMSFVEPLKKKIIELEADLKNLKAQLKRLEMMVQEKEDTIEKLEYESKKKDNEIAVLAKKVDALEAEVAYLRKKLGGGD
jgi:predicted RNase H-like nuclease (RuvC/YqgF family)